MVARYADIWNAYGTPESLAAAELAVENLTPTDVRRCAELLRAYDFLGYVDASLVAVHADPSGDTLEVALAYTYVNNPQLNAQRALVRATDENVPQALAGYRPKASLTGLRRSTSSTTSAPLA